MAAPNTAPADVDPGLLDAIAALPVARDVSHCGSTFQAPPFALFATCPVCGTRVKVRAFAAVPEVEDVFDAVFAWMARPGATEAVRRRQREIAADLD